MARLCSPHQQSQSDHSKRASHAPPPTTTPTAAPISHQRKPSYSPPRIIHRREPTMKAAVFHAAHQPLTIEDVEIEKPKRREVLLRTAYAGLCHSDLHFMEGLYPYPTPAVLGHEGAAVG